MLIDHQLGTVDEVTYGAAVTVTKFHEYNSEDIDLPASRTEGDPLRTGTQVKRSDRFTPWLPGASGPVQLDVMTKGFGFWLKHMLGAVATSGPTETSVYTHTGTFGDLTGDFFSEQIARPLNPSGTVQPITLKGGKITEWTLSNNVDANLICELGQDFQAWDTSTGLASAVYPADMENLTWAGGVITIGGVQIDVDDISIKGSNNLNVDRRKISGSTLKKEPTAGRRSVEWSMTADFESLDQEARVHSLTRAGALAEIVATWTGPTLLGTTIFPSLEVTIPAARFDAWKANAGGPEAIPQALSGVGLFDGTNSPVTIAYKTADATP